MATKLDVEMERGDTKVFRGFLTDEAGAPVNDPSAIYRLAVRTTRDATSAIFTKTGGQVVAGEGRCTIAPTDTSSFTVDRALYYDMDVTESSGQVTTLLKGRLTVLADVAR
jgi:hypothetical protein